MVQTEAECLTHAGFEGSYEDGVKAPSSLYGHCSMRTDLQHVKLSLSLDGAKWQGTFFIVIFCIMAEAPVT